MPAGTFALREVLAHGDDMGSTQLASAAGLPKATAYVKANFHEITAALTQEPANADAMQDSTAVEVSRQDDGEVYLVTNPITAMPGRRQITGHRPEPLDTKRLTLICGGYRLRCIAVRTKSATALDLLCGGQAMTVVTAGASGTGTMA